MALPFQIWRAALQPASFGGAVFHVEAGGKSGGRRLAEHEYPKRDTPFGEDMGRKARRWPITGYCIGPFYLTQRDALIVACEAEGPFTLVHPSLGEEQVNCDSFTVTETREKGGFCTFEMIFFEAGQDPGAAPVDDTQSQVVSAANTSNGAAAGAIDGGLAGQGGIGSDAAASARAAAGVTPVTTPPPAAVGGLSGIPTSYPNVGGIGSA